MIKSLFRPPALDIRKCYFLKSKWRCSLLHSWPLLLRFPLVSNIVNDRESYLEQAGVQTREEYSSASDSTSTVRDRACLAQIVPICYLQRLADLFGAPSRHSKFPHDVEWMAGHRLSLYYLFGVQDLRRARLGKNGSERWTVQQSSYQCRHFGNFPRKFTVWWVFRLFHRFYWVWHKPWSPWQECSHHLAMPSHEHGQL